MISKLEYNIPYFFRPGSAPIPAEYRPWWRLALVLLMLKYNGRGKKLSFKQLQILDWAIRSKENYLNLETFLVTGERPLSSLVSIDPSLNRAVNFGIGKGYLRLLNGSRIELTSKSDEVVSWLYNKEIFVEEVFVLKQVGKQITSLAADRLLG